MKKKAIVVTCCTLFSLLIGCDAPQKTQVSGKITYQNKPVFPGTVVFMGTEGKTFSATLDSNGIYRMPAVEVGQYDACIQTVKLANLQRNALAPSQAPLASEVMSEDLNTADSTGEQSTDQPRIREETVPEKFRTANVAIPDKYNDPKTSGLKASVAKSEELVTIDFQLE